MANKTPLEYRAAIEESKMDIYSPIHIGDDLWIPTKHIQTLLDEGLRGFDLFDMPNRTRSKVIKQEVCKALGYPVPKTFSTKYKPRFTGQQLDTYGQKNRNLQIWNEELSPIRRYAIIQISTEGKVLKVKVVNGQELALLDTTGKITTKYQAQLEVRAKYLELVSITDTTPIIPHTNIGLRFAKSVSPVDEPVSGELIPVAEIYEKLSALVGHSFSDPGRDQERNRGAALHRLICGHLGYSRYEDNGQFPDIRHQLLEVKLQTSPTIDLGLILPDSTDPLDIQHIAGIQPRHCDTRYALFYGIAEGGLVTLTHLFVTTGSDFFSRFRRFEGNVQNGKIQIRLPRDFFE